VREQAGTHESPAARLLAVAEGLPRPDVSAGSSRFLSMLAQLARRTRVTLWVEHDETTGDTPLPSSRVADDRRRLAGLGVEVLPCSWEALRRVLAGPSFDTVLFEFYYTAARYLPVVRDAWPGAVAIIDSVDVHFARLTAGASLGAVPPTWAGDVQRAELMAYRAADAVIAASTDDAAILTGHPPMPPVVCVPMAATPRPRRHGARPPRALFVGHFRHDPNLDGLSWFVRDSWPRVRARQPDATLQVIGSYACRAVHALGAHPGIEVLGYVPDLSPHVDEAAAAIAPLRYGAGMKGKVTDAMAAGLPVVTTSIGAQGLGVVDGRHVLIADDPERFADALSTLFADPAYAATLGLAGQAHIETVCGPPVMAAALRTALEVPRRATADRRAPNALVRRWRLAARQLAYWKLSRARRRVASVDGARVGLTGDEPRDA
jgi:glycosyltransferase involved in cell wall biosynthesis